MLLLFSTFLIIASCFHLHCYRCLCKVCAGGAQTNHSVGAQSNCVTRCDCRGLSLRCCNLRFLNQITCNHVHSCVTFIIINQVLVLSVIFCDFAEFFICNNVFMLCNKYNTCIFTTVLMYYTIFIVAVPYSLDLFISSSSLLCKTCMLLFALPAVTFYPTARVKSNIPVSLRGQVGERGKMTNLH